MGKFRGKCHLERVPPWGSSLEGSVTLKEFLHGVVV